MPRPAARRESRRSGGRREPRARARAWRSHCSPRGALAPAAAAAAAPTGSRDRARARLGARRASRSRRGEVAGAAPPPRAPRPGRACCALLRAAERRGEASDVAAALDRRCDRAARAPGADRAPAPRAPTCRRSSPTARCGSRRRGSRSAAADLPAASVAATGAPALWAQGQTGRGAVVAVLDTGIAAGFPQLSTGRGSWFDPYDAAQDAVRRGRARARHRGRRHPRRRWRRTCACMAARVFSDGGRSTTSAVHRVFEWVLDPDGDPAHRRRAGRRQRLVGRRRPGPLRARVRRRHRGPARRRHRAGLRGRQRRPGAPARAAAPPRRRAPSRSAASPAADVVSPFSGRGPSPCGGAPFPTLSAYGEAIALQAPGGGTTTRLGHLVRGAAGQRRARAARRDVPGRDPRRARRRARPRRARRRARPAPTPTPAPACSTWPERRRCSRAPTTPARA